MTAFIRTNGCAATPRAILNDPWLSQFFADPAARATAAEIRLDVEETAASYQVRADLPGVAKDQIKVEIDEDVLRISVDYKREATADARMLRVERASGPASRAIRLPVAVDAAKADAKHVDGVLVLTLPKAAPAAKRLTIN
jgi:HSP20 family protein